MPLSRKNVHTNTKHDSDKYHWHSICLSEGSHGKEYNYSKAGGYFAAVCVEEHGCVLGEVRSDKMELNPVGEIVERYWNELPNKFVNVRSNNASPHNQHNIR